MKKLDYSPRTLDEKIIKDGSCAVATLSDNPISRGLYFVVGGIATQSYLPSNCRRPTSDIDLAILKNLSYSNFKSFSKTVYEYLRDNGYEVENRKAQRSFCMDFKDKENNLSFIEFARDSGKTFDGKKEMLERERANAKSKTSTYLVASPEDIIVPKLARSVNSLDRNQTFKEYLSRMQNLSDAEVKKNLKKIEDLRLEAVLNPGDIRNAEILRFVSDLYDIRLLSELAGVNDQYFRESVNDWITLREHPDKMGLIAKFVLPNELFLN